MEPAQALTGSKWNSGVSSMAACCFQHRTYDKWNSLIPHTAGAPPGSRASSTSTGALHSIVVETDIQETMHAADRWQLHGLDKMIPMQSHLLHISEPWRGMPADRPNKKVPACLLWVRYIDSHRYQIVRTIQLECCCIYLTTKENAISNSGCRKIISREGAYLFRSPASFSLLLSRPSLFIIT